MSSTATNATSSPKSKLNDINGPWIEVVDKPIRSVIKSISYRLFGSTATAGISFVFTHNATAALSIGLVEFCTKFGIFYFHERAWTKITFGRKKVFHDYEI